MKSLAPFLAVIIFSGNLFAAIISANDSLRNDKQRKLKIALDYSSDNTFKGRRDTTNTPLISPNIKYTGRSGLFAQAALFDVPGKKRKTKVFDELDLGVGKNFDISEKWDASVAYSHYFYDSKVARIKSSVQNDFNASLNYDWDILYNQLVADVNMGAPKSKKGKTVSRRSLDYSLTLVSMHDFDIKLNENNKLTISPEADILFGTQNFLTSYKGKTDLAYAQFQKQASAFNLTAYIFYINVSWKVKKLTASISPYYTIPENMPQGESSKPYFVMSGSIYYTFKSKPKAR